MNVSISAGGLPSNAGAIIKIGKVFYQLDNDRRYWIPNDHISSQVSMEQMPDVIIARTSAGVSFEVIQGYTPLHDWKQNVGH